MAGLVMEKKGKVVFFVLLIAMFQGCSSAPRRIGSSAVFRVHGNVYPKGSYYVSLDVGQPPRQYYFDIDTGSDLTWLQCDYPCISCTETAHPLYEPPKKNEVFQNDTLCIAAFNTPEDHESETPDEPCGYEVSYTDQGSSRGVLVRDVFPIRFTDGSLLRPILAFGCGFEQRVSDATPRCTDGVLGLSKAKSSILSQLHDQGLTKNVIAHCFSRRGGGYMFFGDDFVPSSGVIWTRMSRNSFVQYSPGPTELIFGGQPSGVRGLVVAFDTGSSYTYFNSEAYQAFISWVKKDLVGKPLMEAPDDKTLTVCFRGTKPFESIHDAKKYFNPIALSFTNDRRTQMEIPPEAYLIISKHGNVCLGILNGTQVGLEKLNLIGDISFQDKLVIYDNEKQKIGWFPTDCRSPSIVDHDDNEGFSRPYAARMGVVTESYPATSTSREDKFE